MREVPGFAEIIALRKAEKAPSRVTSCSSAAERTTTLDPTYLRFSAVQSSPKCALGGLTQQNLLFLDIDTPQ